MFREKLGRLANSTSRQVEKSRKLPGSHKESRRRLVFFGVGGNQVKDALGISGKDMKMVWKMD